LRTRKGVRKINKELPTREELQAMSDEEFDKVWELIVAALPVVELIEISKAEFAAQEAEFAAQQNEA
jgi:hypothetical protein